MLDPGNCVQWRFVNYNSEHRWNFTHLLDLTRFGWIVRSRMEFHSEFPDMKPGFKSLRRENNSFDVPKHSKWSHVQAWGAPFQSFSFLIRHMMRVASTWKWVAALFRQKDVCLWKREEWWHSQVDLVVSLVSLLGPTRANPPGTSQRRPGTFSASQELSNGRLRRLWSDASVLIVDLSPHGSPALRPEHASRHGRDAGLCYSKSIASRSTPLLYPTRSHRRN